MLSLVDDLESGEVNLTEAIVGTGVSNDGLWVVPLVEGEQEDPPVESFDPLLADSFDLDLRFCIN